MDRREQWPVLTAEEIREINSAPLDDDELQGLDDPEGDAEDDEFFYFEDPGDPPALRAWTATAHREAYVAATIEKAMRRQADHAGSSEIGRRLHTWLNASVARGAAVARILIDSIDHGIRSPGDIVATGWEFLLDPASQFRLVPATPTFMGFAPANANSAPVVAVRSTDGTLRIDVISEADPSAQTVRVAAINDGRWALPPLVVLVPLEEGRPGFAELLKVDPENSLMMRATFAAPTGTYVIMLEPNHSTDDPGQPDTTM